MGNQALIDNPPFGLDIHITAHGSDWYWTAFTLFALVTLAYLAGALTLRPANERLFFFSSISSVFVLAITYYTLASDLGWTGIATEFGHVGSSAGEFRQIFYARYVGWFLAFPGFIGSFAVLSAAPWSTTIFSILTIEVFVVSLLIGSLIHSTYKWGYFVFGLVALFLTFFNLLGTFRLSANTYGGPEVHRIITIAGGATSFLLFLYPIAWGLSEGGNVIQPDSEAAFYGVLDVLLFIVVGLVFQFLIRSLDFAQLGIVSSSRPFFHNDEKLAPAGSAVPTHPVVNEPGVTAPNTAVPTETTTVDPAVTGPNAV